MAKLIQYSIIPALRQDLALLENQIPFFVLQKLYHIIMPYVVHHYTPPNSVTRLALQFFQPMNHKALARDTEDCNHLLDLLHKFCFLPLLTIKFFQLHTSSLLEFLVFWDSIMPLQNFYGMESSLKKGQWKAICST